MPAWKSQNPEHGANNSTEPTKMKMTGKAFIKSAAIVAAICGVFALAPAAEAKDNKHRNNDRGSNNKGRDQRFGHSHNHDRHLDVRFCGSHRHHHTHVWHSRDHRDFICHGHD